MPRKTWWTTNVSPKQINKASTCREDLKDNGNAVGNGYSWKILARRKHSDFCLLYLNFCQTFLFGNHFLIPLIFVLLNFTTRHIPYTQICNPQIKLIKFLNQSTIQSKSIKISYIYVHGNQNVKKNK